LPENLLIKILFQIINSVACALVELESQVAKGWVLDQEVSQSLVLLGSSDREKNVEKVPHFINY
jgi:hypothetical protein